LCRCPGIARRFVSGRDSHKVCKKKVTIGKKYQAMDNQPVEPEAEAQGPEMPCQTLARKRGRPSGLKTVLSPLEQKEKRMKSAKEKFHEEKFALATKIIEFHCDRRFDDHASTVARLRQRLDDRAKRVVELQMDAERAEAEWDHARCVEAAEAAQALLGVYRANQALSEDLREAHTYIEELHQQLEKMQAAMHEAELESADEVLKVRLEAHEAAVAKLAVAREATKKAREHELRMYGVL
jgi:hypothetical protein